VKSMISLVSEQTVPNLLGILHFEPEVLLFLSTERMEREGRVRAILAALEQRRPGVYRMEENTYVVQVQEDSILDCHRKLDRWIVGREDNDFIINLTGGTKLMSIAAFEYFKDYASKMIYIPLNKNEYIIPFPKRSPRPPIPLTDRLSVMEYLTAYGLEVLNDRKMDEYKMLAEKRKDLSCLATREYGKLNSLLTWLGEQLREKRKIRKSCDFSVRYKISNDIEKEFLTEFGFSMGSDKHYRMSLTKSDIAYLTGGWLEEYCFNVVWTLLGKGIDDAALNIDIKNRQGRNNEFDVMFTSNNALYFIECKSLEQIHDKKFDALYKIGALQKEFGLRVKSFLVTTSSQIIDAASGEVKTGVAERAAQFNTKVVKPDEVKDFSSILAAELKN